MPHSSNLSACHSCVTTHCHGCSQRPAIQSRWSRRDFVAAGALAFTPLRSFASASPPRQAPISLPLRVQPVLTYEIPQKREGTSYRSWGGVQTEQDLAQEKERIGRELAALRPATPSMS